MNGIKKIELMGNTACLIDVTKQVQKVFGADVVQRAYLNPHLLGSTEAEIRRAEKKAKERAELVAFQDPLETNRAEVYVQLVNGRVVSFWNSEWGGFQPLGKTDEAVKAFEEQVNG